MMKQEEFDDDDYSEEADENEDRDDDELDRDEYEEENFDGDNENLLDENQNGENEHDDNHHDNENEIENQPNENEQDQDQDVNQEDLEDDDNDKNDIDNQQEDDQQPEIALDENQSENEESKGNEDIEEINVRPRRERVPNRFLHDGNYVFEQQQIDDSQAEKVEYSNVNGKILAMAMHQMSLKFSGITTVKHCNVQTFSLKQGIKKFGERGKQAAMKELRQLHDRVVFEPVDVSTLTSDDKQKAMESLIFLAEKRDFMSSLIDSRNVLFGASEVIVVKI